jgi:hypothetical protein
VIESEIGPDPGKEQRKNGNVKKNVREIGLQDDGVGVLHQRRLGLIFGVSGMRKEWKGESCQSVF